ncbi:hypothetical protein TRFO_12616 [Tritrichomonas foetus]|uniref:Leucine Rich Repeat family protein n=1 Tax=Tritrichomonas foetus TaxID=1144522 RepID=A0A1J4L204_9EUKA|nr:hypothetical protein TRFO_12616 [Tritrichomonas foetus]|eukprot:OHT17104.1 hypothetical protein TRFO_12616 [Tritrichomonas foetus]
MEKKEFQVASSKAKHLQLTIIDFYQVKEHNNSRFATNKIFGLSTTHFYLSDKRKDTKDVLLAWKQLTGIDIKGNKLCFEFNKEKYEISSKEKFEEIKNRIFEILYRVLTHHEKKKLKLSRFGMPAVGPTPRSPIIRYLMWKITQKNKCKKECELSEVINDQTDNKFRFSMIYQSNFLSLIELPELELFLPIYLDSLKVAPQVKQLRLPLIPSLDTYDLVTDLLSENAFIEFLEIAGKSDGKLSFLIKAIKDNKKSHINALSFVHSQFRIEDLEILYDFIVKGPIHSLELHSAMRSSSLDYFYSTFLTPLLCEKLAILNLNKTLGLNVDKLFPKVRNISMLSLENCDIDLGATLNSLAKSSLIGLQVLNISGCMVKTLPDQDSQVFNKNFTKLVINDVSWPKDTFVPFFEYIFSHFTNGLRLFFSNEVASDEEWLKLFQFIKESSYTHILELGWNHNPTHIELINFLRRSVKITHLEMTGCFDEDAPEAIDSLCDYLKYTNSFKTLILQGNEEHHFGQFTKKVITSLHGHRSLVKLDISESYGAEDVLECLVPLVEAISALRFLKFDGLKCTNIQLYTETLTDLSKFKDTVKISFPINDLKDFKQEGQFQKGETRDLGHLYKLPIPKDERVENLKELCEDYMMYMMMPEQNFPSNVTDEEFEELKKEKKQPAVLVGNNEAVVNKDESIYDPMWGPLSSPDISPTQPVSRSIFTLENREQDSRQSNKNSGEIRKSEKRKSHRRGHGHRHHYHHHQHRRGYRRSSRRDHSRRSRRYRRSDYSDYDDDYDYGYDEEIKTPGRKSNRSPFKYGEDDEYSSDLSEKYNSKLRSISRLPVNEDDVESDSDEKFRSRNIRHSKKSPQSSSRKFNSFVYGRIGSRKRQNDNDYSEDDENENYQDRYKSGPSRFKKALIPRRQAPPEIDAPLPPPRYDLPEFEDYSKCPWAKYNNDFALDEMYADLVDERRRRSIK